MLKLIKQWSSKTLSRYNTTFDDVDKTLLVLSAKSGSVSTASCTTAIGATVRITSKSLGYFFY